MLQKLGLNKSSFQVRTMASYPASRNNLLHPVDPKLWYRVAPNWNLIHGLNPRDFLHLAATIGRNPPSRAIHHFRRLFPGDSAEPAAKCGSQTVPVFPTCRSILDVFEQGGILGITPQNMAISCCFSWGIWWFTSGLLLETGGGLGATSCQLWTNPG